MDHIEISKSLLSENIRMMSNKSTLNKMIYSNIITAMEAYLSDTFIGITMNDPGLIRRFIETSADFKKEKVEIQKVFEWIEDSANMVKSKLMDTTFHNIIKVKENYKNVLDVDFINEGALIHIINRRHDIVHRNGKDKEGNSFEITDEDIQSLISHVSVLIGYIDEQISGKFYKKDIDENILTENYAQTMDAYLNFGHKFNEFIHYKSFLESKFNDDFMFTQKGTDKTTIAELVDLLEENGMDENVQFFKTLFYPLEELEVPFHASISILDILKFNRLKILHLQGNAFDNKPSDMGPRRDHLDLLASMKQLEVLNLGRNQLTDISFLSNLTNLKTLWVHDNGIASIDCMSHLTKLKSLTIFKNKITDITSLEKLINLEELDLARNQVRNLGPLRGLKKLERLNLNHNDVEDISVLFDLPQLKTLHISDNRVDPTDLERLKLKIPTLAIYSEHRDWS
ncbi:leucine-rich repeat domain-containing protein [Cohnella cholangitidis]|nr:leucine-rich repeat domain-containing protein [Cohnella cholangitidis]